MTEIEGWGSLESATCDWWFCWCWPSHTSFMLYCLQSVAHLCLGGPGHSAAELH